MAGDADAVRTIAARVWALAEQKIFPGSVDFLLFEERPDLAVRGTAFRVQFRLQSDVLGPKCERPMLRLLFIPTEADGRLPWELYVRGDWPRSDRVSPRFARRLRRRLAPQKRRPADRQATAIRNDDVYVMPGTPADDLYAQIGLFCLQTGLSADPDLHRSLTAYLIHTFRLGRRERREAAQDALVRLINDKWFSEDARGWHKYVAAICRAAARPYRSLGVGLEESRDLPRRVVAASRRPVEPYDPSGAVLTVSEAAVRIGMPKRTLYNWIERREITAHYDAQGRAVIAATACGETLHRTAREVAR